MTLTISLTGRRTGEDFDTLVNGADRINAKLPLFNGLHHVTAQHQISQIGAGQQNSLVSSQSLEPADIEKSLDLAIDPTDGLDLTALIHRSGYRDALFDGNLGETGKNGVELSG